MTLKCPRPSRVEEEKKAPIEIGRDKGEKIGMEGTKMKKRQVTKRR